MALNLSRNTKVFVSSANGVPTAGSGVATAYVQAGGSGYDVGDIVTLTAGGGNGVDAKCIVLTENGSNVVTSVAIPNNFRGDQHVTYADNSTNGTLTSSAVQDFAGNNQSGGPIWSNPNPQPECFSIFNGNCQIGIWIKCESDHQTSTSDRGFFQESPSSKRIFFHLSFLVPALVEQNEGLLSAPLHKYHNGTNL